MKVALNKSLSFLSGLGSRGSQGDQRLSEPIDEKLRSKLVQLFHPPPVYGENGGYFENCAACLELESQMTESLISKSYNYLLLDQSVLSAETNRNWLPQVRLHYIS